MGVLACQSSNPLDNILQDSRLQYVLEQADTYEVQIRYTQIDRDANNNPTFKTYDFNVDSSVYFYPASSVKMPVAFLAMERINELRKEKNIPFLNVSSTIEIDSTQAGQSEVRTDSTSMNGLPNVAHYVKKIFAVSDNDAFNRLYEFLGRQYINEQLQAKGMQDSRIMHRLSVWSLDNAVTNPLRFVDGDSILYKQDEQIDQTNYPITAIPKGVAYFKNDEKIEEPFDFGAKNRFSIADLERSLKAIIFPDATAQNERFDLTAENYQYLYKVMSTLPREHEFPKYDTTEYYDSYVKFFLFGDKKEPIPEHIRIFNKVGYAYGYLTDCAYIVDFKKNIEFFLTATIHVNANQIYNDNTYEYDEVGIPFLANLGRAVYDYEVNRKRPNKPDLSKFR